MTQDIMTDFRDLVHIEKMNFFKKTKEFLYCLDTQRETPMKKISKNTKMVDLLSY